MSTAALKGQRARPAAPWWEVIVVMAASLALTLADERLKVAGILLPVPYLIFERRLRGRSWSDLGFNFKNTPTDLLHNLGWVLLVGVGTPVLQIFGLKLLLPGFYAQFAAHLVARSPLDVSGLTLALVLSLVLAALGEEIIFRGLFQKRLTAFLPLWPAIGLTSLVFALIHLAPGAPAVVAVDLLWIVIDSVIYGIIFHRTNNVYAAGAAHFLSNLTAVILLLTVVI